MRSFDRGDTWEDVSKGIDYLDIHVIANFPKRHDRYYVASARGFFTSDTPETGWTRAETGMTRDYFHDFLFLNPQTPGEPATMLIGTADGSPGFWRRENRGARAAIYQKHRRRSILDADNQRPRRQISTPWCGRWCITRPITTLSSPASATSPAATPPAPAAPAI